MRAGQTPYKPLSRSRLLRLGQKRAWLTDDHLLVISPGFLNERYTRLYWGDIQAILLYALEQPNRWFLAGESVCALAPVAAAVWWTWQEHAFRFPTLLIVAVLFEVIYGWWRVTRFRWACVITTKTSGARLPLSVSLSSAQKAAAELTNRVHAVQGTLDRTRDVPSELITSQRPPFPSKKPTLVLHAVVFALGALQLVSRGSWQNPSYTVFRSALGVLYFSGLVCLYFFQRDFEFPFAVRSAAVMSQIMEFLWNGVVLGGSAAGLAGNSFLFSGVGGANIAVGIVQMLFSLCGLIALNAWSLGRAEAKRPQSSIFNLG